MTEFVEASRQALRYVWSHRIHVFLCVPMLVGVTVVHELAHAVAVLLQGGTVTHVSIWPSGGNWGYTKWIQPLQGLPYPALVSLAPYILWLTMAAVAACLAFVPARKPFWFASIVFVWFYAVPVLDIANAAVVYAYRGSGDLAKVFGASLMNRVLVLDAIGIVLSTAGFPVQRGLYGARALGVGAYAILITLAAVALVTLQYFV